MSQDLFQPADASAKDLAQQLMASAQHGALAVLKDGAPFVSRIALAPQNGAFLTLISDLAPHTAALRDHPTASLMVGDPGRGDPLAHPRLTLSVSASFVDKSETAETYLQHQPKAKLYIGFADFHMVHLSITDGLLNGGFGKAFRLTPEDLTI